MNRLEIDFLNIQMKNPVIAASGTYGFGECYGDYYEPALLGGICCKGLTLNGSCGNRGTRLWETKSGLLNSIGMENPGIDGFIQDYYSDFEKIDTAKIVNLGGTSVEEYIEAVEKLNHLNVDIIELNISCPNVKQGGMALGVKAENAYLVTKGVKEVSKHKVMVKLTPNAENIVEVAKACEEGGADALSLINTILGMAVDIEKRRPVFDNVYAGLSGPAVKPIALRMVNQVYMAVSIPIMGIGGISTWKDALEFIMAGATCIQVGTANFINPSAAVEIIKGLDEYCLGNNVNNISELVGIV